MIFLEDENVNIIVFVIELTALSCTHIIKNPVSRYFFSYFLITLKNFFAFLYVTMIIFTRRLRESHSRCLTYINVAVEKIDLLQRVKFLLVFFLFFLGITTALSVTKLPLNLSIYFLYPSVSRFIFWRVMYLMCMSIVYLFLLSYISIF